LIEGAHKGVGLGTRFLRHVERTRLIAHLIDTSDASQRDPVRDYEIIMGELEAFSPALIAKPMIIVATKLDMTTDRTRLDELAAFCKARGLEFHSISSATGEGIKELIFAMADALDKLPRAFPDAHADEATHAETSVANENHADAASPDEENEAAARAGREEEDR
jgi:GTPase